MKPDSTLLPRLPAVAWRMLVANLLSAVGSGLTLPFAMVYLHSVRGLGFGIAGAVVACIGLASLVGNPLGGWLADVMGPRSALVAGLSAAAVGAAGWAVVTGPASAALAAALSGFGVSVV